MRLEELVVHANLGCLYFERLAAELLITHSNGWRRLAVSFQRSHLLDMSAYLNQPDCYDFARRYFLADHRLNLMPEQFIQALQHRDGPQTLPSVRLEQNSELPYPDLTAPGTVHAHHSLHSPYCRNRHPLPHVDFVWRKPLWVRAERGQGVDYTVPPLREDASEDRPYLQTKEKILQESSGSGLRHRVVKCDYRSLQYGWDDELHSAGRSRR
ncbi:hypothetical protein PG991_011808 [Apiospora marii]|uniref:Uncharacterized protein n=1 Tax=Apiospora marii TaxID=335849 RepID=A0ABR1RGF2_9PEZI